jgi:hypothetical protein
MFNGCTLDDEPAMFIDQAFGVLAALMMVEVGDDGGPTMNGQNLRHAINGAMTLVHLAGACLQDSKQA